MNALNVTTGMTVFSRDNVELGKVKEVWAETEAHGCLPVSQYLLEDYGPIRGTSQLLSTEEGFLQIRQSDTFGFGGRDLWVPLNAVSDVDAHASVALEMEAVMYEASLVERPTFRENAA